MNQSSSVAEAEEKERQAYKRIPLVERMGSLVAWIGASIAFGIGTNSVAIGIGTLLALAYLGSQLNIEMSKHRGCR
jgi:phosphate/sulfate permease